MVAEIERFALAGGFEIALACDPDRLRPQRQARLPEVSVGLAAGGGGPLRLPRQIAYLVALQIALTGQPISAEVAYQVGLVNELTGPGEALAAALGLRRADRRERPGRRSRSPSGL
jgi:enoyl-CoA hydratase/carnithine racemase